MGDTMNIYNMIRDMDDEEIEKYLSYEIYSLENRSKQNNKGDIIGYNLPCLPTKCDLLKRDVDDEFLVSVRCFYGGYVPKEVKIVYGFSSNNNGVFSNEGMYYVMDDDSYLYDFCKYIRNIDVVNEKDFFEYVLLFIKNYFGFFKDRSRDEMFQLILTKDNTFYEPVKEHKFSDFKRKGNAMCSEYTVMANNILSVFGFDSYIIVGQEKSDEDDEDCHAFNLVSYVDGNYERIDALIDFAYSVDVVDINFNKIGESPYIIYLDDLNDEFVDDLINNELHLIDYDYDLMIMGDKLLQLINDKKRDYFIGSKLIEKTCKVDVKSR